MKGWHMSLLFTAEIFLIVPIRWCWQTSFPTAQTGSVGTSERWETHRSVLLWAAEIFIMSSHMPGLESWLRLRARASAPLPGSFSVFPSSTAASVTFTNRTFAHSSLSGEPPPNLFSAEITYLLPDPTSRLGLKARFHWLTVLTAEVRLGGESRMLQVAHLRSSRRSHSVWCLMFNLFICSAWVCFSSWLTRTWLTGKKEHSWLKTRKELKPACSDLSPERLPDQVWSSSELISSRFLLSFRYDSWRELLLNIWASIDQKGFKKFQEFSWFIKKTKPKKPLAVTA